MLLAITTKLDRHSPALGENTEDIFEGVGRIDRPAGKGDDLVVIAQAAAKRVGRFQNIRNADAAALAHGDGRAERGVIDDAAALQAAEEVFDLVDGDRVANANVDTAAFFKAAAAIDADQIAVGVEKWPAGIAGVDRGVGL